MRKITVLIMEGRFPAWFFFQEGFLRDFFCLFLSHSSFYQLFLTNSNSTSLTSQSLQQISDNKTLSKQYRYVKLKTTLRALKSCRSNAARFATICKSMVWNVSALECLKKKNSANKILIYLLVPQSYKIIIR